MYALSQISSYLLAQSWQIAILITAVALMSFALRHRSAHIRYLLWLVVLAKCLVPPLLTVPLAVLPEKAILDLPTTSVIVPQASEAVAFEPVSPPTHFVQVPESNTTAAQKNRTLGQYLALGWMVGAVLYGLAALMQALWSTIWLRRRRLELSVDQHQQVEAIFTKLDIRSVPKIWLVPGMAQPFVWGLWRGSLYLPTNFFQVKSTEHCRDILVHELCHVLRLDAAVNLLQAIAQAIFWFHPFVWWANQKIRMEREKCCDEMVVALLDAKVKEYSTAIVKALVTEHESAWPVPSLAVAGSAKDIEERIRTMMRPGKTFYKRPSVVVAMIVLALALITVPTALVLTARAATEMDMVPPHRAASSGHITEVEQWLAQGGDVNVKSVAGETLLRRALLRDRQDIIQLLQKHGADIDAEIQNDPSLIRWVATNGSPAVADDLISRGADTSHVYVASYLGNLDQVKEYIESGSQQVSAYDKNQILLGAITGGHANIIEYILDHGADIKQWGILHRAVGANRKQILELLIDKGADPNPGGDWSPLHITIAHYPRLKIAKALLSHGADPYKQKGENTWNPMHFAIDTEQSDMVKLFLDYRRDKNLLHYVYYAIAENRKDVLPLFEPYVKISPIHLSCFYGKLDDVKSYLEQGNDIEAQDIGGLSLLRFAVVGCQIEIVDYLIAKGCNVNSKASDGTTALHHAANGNGKGEEMVQRLITAGALVEAKDNNHCTPFFYSVSGVSNDLGAAQVLLKHGADINIQRIADGATAIHDAARRNNMDILIIGDGVTALHDAARRNSMKRMKWLIAKGADVNRRNKNGSTPLSVAVQKDRLEAVQYILEHGADINYHDERGRTPLSYAVLANNKEIVEMLLKKDADITVQDRGGRTATGRAIEKGYTEIVELLSNRAKLLDPKKEIMTIFDYAAIGDTEKIKSLIAAGQNVNTKSRDGTVALYWASVKGYRDIAELLIQNGANVNIIHSDGGWTTLLYACHYGKKEMVELLLANGAEINVKNNEGSTALDIASQRKHTEIVELLQKHGAKE